MDEKYTHPVEIARDVFWVGGVLPGDPFQCHAYLIRNDDESVLIDPGSVLTISETVRKISEVTELKNIKYMVCHHQDPDIASAVSMIEGLIKRDDKFIVTHWRAKALLRHYNWETPFWLIDEHHWELILKNGRTLKFVFTPYAHFPGAFCTFDTMTRTLFSSDLFGGFTERFSLFAQDEKYFQAMRPFHEHYLPSRDILHNAIVQLEQCDPELVAPQHGSIIPKHLIRPMMRGLKRLECGLFRFGGSSDIQKLFRINTVLKGIVDNFVYNPRLMDALRNMKTLMGHLVPLDDILVLAPVGEDVHRLIMFSMDIDSPSVILKDKDIDRFLHLIENIRSKGDIEELDDIAVPGSDQSRRKGITAPLVTRDRRFIGAAIALLKEGHQPVDSAYLEVFKNFIMLLSVALQRELGLMATEIEKEKMYQCATIDELTGLHNRFYMDTVVSDVFHKAREMNQPLSVALFDIDFFKKVNDTYGHLAGDSILKGVSKIIKKSLRKGDIAIRYGGEELLVVLPSTRRNNATKVAERIRKKVEATAFQVEGHTIGITLSTGVTELEDEPTLEALIKKADENLYRAKTGGRNRVVSN